MKQTRQASHSVSNSSPVQESSATDQDKPKRRIQSTAEILARGVSLSEVQKAVHQLRPQVHQVG